jgi:ATP-dependent helicase HepA
MPFYKAGQRYMSETEPELGLGLISEVGEKQLQVQFPAANIQRVYGLKTAPLKRVKFQVDDEVFTREGLRLLIQEIEEKEDILYYRGEAGLVCETELEDALAFSRPEEKLFNGQIDSQKFFELRQEALRYKKAWDSSPYKGYFGGRISLIPHQFYIAQKIGQMFHPRVLLADEVGLGKTIEAGIILHQLITSKRGERVLVLVPDSLVYQWFFEMHRKFQLGFVAINQETYLEEDANPFMDNQRVIVSLGLIKGSEKAQDLLAEAEFDVLVVDEAHQYKVSENESSWEYKLLQGLCTLTPSVLLLTATPEQLGMEGHFHRLHLLDPDRFSSYEQFKKEVQEFSKAAEMAQALEEMKVPEMNDKWFTENELDYLKKGELSVDKNNELIEKLIDRHGTGRVFFRNTRQVMRKVYDFFPERILHPYPLICENEIEGHHDLSDLGSSFYLKTEWLLNYLKGNSEKTLLICHSKNKILELEKFIRENLSGVKTGVFHSGLGLMARDRQAAYFAEPDGAQILLCTEIGSEGRNFEFSHHLVLFDLPKKPDLLEQRIGRLDRIGQKADINIHVPYVEKSWEEVLYKIYEEALKSFSKFSSVGTPVFVHFQERVHQSLDEQKLPEGLIEEMTDYARDLEKEMEESRDFLVEKNSFQSEKAKELISNIKKLEQLYDLPQFMELAWESFGVDVEELNSHATFIRPNDNMFIPYFPELAADGMTITFDRREALEREDYHFLNWDHPMVTGVIDLIMSENIGSTTVVSRKGASKSKKSFIEAYFVLETQAPAAFEMGKYLPPTVLRVLIDKDGEDFADKWTKEVLDEKVEFSGKETLIKASNIPKKFVKELLKQAEEKALEKSLLEKEKGLVHLQSEMNQEIERLEELSTVNQFIDEEDILEARKLLELKEYYIQRAEMRLDSLRLIL